MSEVETRMWPAMDPVRDSIPGISLTAACSLLSEKKSEDVVVGIIDSGIDIEHDDLLDNLWTNSREVKSNNVDDDSNGRIDDAHGWNFLGNATENIYFTQREETRIVKRYAALFRDSANSRRSSLDTAHLALYDKGKRQFDKGLKDVSQAYYNGVQSDNLSSNDLQYLKLLEIQNMFHYNLDFEARELIGDSEYDLSDSIYGNGDVIGLRENAKHGTHVAGIIVAAINKPAICNQIDRKIKIMAIRAIPNGDEYDKDVALAIRYAVNEGAKVVNLSFGKSLSQNPEMVYDAIAYAESRDVLLVLAAGNEAKDLDVFPMYPNDSYAKVGTEFAKNLIVVGAVAPSLNENLVATYSNYGKNTVDIFAPGSQIYSTFPGNLHGFNNGTSMAAPWVSYVASIIRSYYPKLSAREVKEIIMNSGTRYDASVIIPGQRKVKNFKELSVSGSFLNAYNAIRMASKMAK